MMSIDYEILQDFLERVASKYTASELVELLEDAGIVDIWDVIAALEEYIVEGRNYLEV